MEEIYVSSFRILVFEVLDPNGLSIRLAGVMMVLKFLRVPAFVIIMVSIGCGVSSQINENQTVESDTSQASPEVTSPSSSEAERSRNSLTLSFEITSPPKKLSNLSEVFPKFVSVWGISIIATESTPDEKILHAANVMAQYLDNDENGIPDDSRVIEALVKNKSILAMARTEYEFEEVVDLIIETGLIEELISFSVQGLYGSETAPSDAFDASLEEVHHLLLNYGWGEVYPEELNQQKGSAIADAMDVARGGVFDNVPSTYPDEAWYTYDDWTCDYSCMVTEYVYWAHTSLLGGQEGRFDEIGWEWRFDTPEKIRSGDPVIVSILENPELRLPTVLPDGSYGS